MKTVNGFHKEQQGKEEDKLRQVFGLSTPFFVSNVQCVSVNAYITLVNEFFKGDSAVREVILELLLSFKDLVLAQSCFLNYLLDQLPPFFLGTFLQMIFCLRQFLWLFVTFQ